MNAKRNIFIVITVVVTLLLSTAGWNAAVGNGDDYEQSIQWGNDLAWSVEGVWVISAPTPVGPMLFLHNMHAQDLTGTRYGGTLWQVNSNPTTFGAFPDAEEGGCYWVTQTIRTGPNTGELVMVTYSTKKVENAPSELVSFGFANATWTMTGPDTNEGQAMLATYLASQDADHDGFPDEGEEPVSCMPFTFTSKRLRVIPGCVPSPMPEAPTQ